MKGVEKWIRDRAEARGRPLSRETVELLTKNPIGNLPTWISVRSRWRF